MDLLITWKYDHKIFRYNFLLSENTLFIVSDMIINVILKKYGSETSWFRAVILYYYILRSKKIRIEILVSNVSLIGLVDYKMTSIVCGGHFKLEGVPWITI